MSLRECFERFDPETWADNLGMNRLLFCPPETYEDPKVFASVWVKRILGINSGRISFKRIFEENLSRDRFSEAFESLQYCSDKEQSELKKKITEHLHEHYNNIIRKTENLNERLLAIEERIINREGKLLLNEIKEKTNSIKKWISPELLSYQGMRSFEFYTKEINELEELVCLLELEDASFLSKSLNVFYKILDRIKYLFEKSEGYPKKLVEQCFLSLPVLVLKGRFDILSKISEAINAGDFEQLREIELPRGYTPRISTLEEIEPRLRKDKEKKEIPSFSFRIITKKVLDGIPKLDEYFESIEKAREFIEKKVKGAKTFMESANILLGGAKTIMSMGGKNVLYLQARGLMELAEYQLNLRKYNYAFELFADSFSLWVCLRPEIEAISAEERRATTGILLANWAPKIIGRQQYKDISELTGFFFENPTIMLEKIAEANDLEVIFHSFDQLNEFESLKSFLEYLQETCPTVEWGTILSERILQPRLFFQKPMKGILNLRVLTEGKFKEVGFNKIIENLGSAIDAATLGEKTFSVEVHALERDYKELCYNVDNNPDLDSSGLRSLLVGLDTMIKTMRSKVQLANEIECSVRPVNTLFFLGEKFKGLELIFNVTLSESSLPASAFRTEVRIESKQRDRFVPFISFHDSNIELGPLEPGSTEEIRFILDIDKDILQEYSEIPIELNFFEGVRVIEPTDKKNIFQIYLRNNRKGSRINPYVAGPAIEKGSLYVGREQELDKIKNTLIGQSQDNIPLVLGIRRIGKTSLLKRLIEDEEIKRKYVPVFYDLQDMAESETTADFLKKLSSKIHDICGEKWKIHFSRNDFDNKDPFEAFEKYMLSFSSAPGTLRILIVMDEFEKLINNLRKWQERIKNLSSPPDPRNALVPEVFGSLRKAMLHATRTSFIIAGLPQIRSSLQDYEARWFGLMTPIVLKPLDEEEAKKLIQPDQIPYKLSSEAIDEILYMTGRQPYLIQLICKNLFNDIIESGREAVARSDVEIIIKRDILPNEAFFADYKRLMGEDTHILKAISIIHKKFAKRRHFVNVDEISEILNKSGKGLPREQLTDQLKEMQKAERPLVERSPSRSDAYRIVIGLLGSILEEGEEV